MPRSSVKAGCIVKQLSTEVSARDHKRLREHAQNEKRSVQEILRGLILPYIRSLPAAKES